jgi:hypothetical protein
MGGGWLGARNCLHAHSAGSHGPMANGDCGASTANPTAVALGRPSSRADCSASPPGGDLPLVLYLLGGLHHHQQITYSSLVADGGTNSLNGEMPMTRGRRGYRGTQSRGAAHGRGGRARHYLPPLPAEPAPVARRSILGPETWQRFQGLHVAGTCVSEAGQQRSACGVREGMGVGDGGALRRGCAQGLHTRCVAAAASTQREVC